MDYLLDYWIFRCGQETLKSMAREKREKTNVLRINRAINGLKALKL